MAFWDDLGQKASQTTVKAVQKAKDLAEIAKLNGSLAEAEARIQDAYCQIGKTYAAQHPQDYGEEYAAMFAVIQEAGEKIRICQQQIRDIKGVVLCSRCGAEAPYGASFCSACGAAIPKPQSVEAEVMEKCGSCGAMVSHGADFCTVCGQPMTRPEADPGDDPAETTQAQEDETTPETAP